LNYPFLLNEIHATHVLEKKIESMSRGKIVMACQYATNVKQCAYPANGKRKRTVRCQIQIAT
jgi:hypothetical protein